MVFDKEFDKTVQKSKNYGLVVQLVIIFLGPFSMVLVENKISIVAIIILCIAIFFVVSRINNTTDMLDEELENRRLEINRLGNVISSYENGESNRSSSRDED